MQKMKFRVVVPVLWRGCWRAEVFVFALFDGRNAKPKAMQWARGKKGWWDWDRATREGIR